MPVTINGNGSITGLSAGGLPAGSVTDATIAGMAASKAFWCQCQQYQMSIFN